MAKVLIGGVYGDLFVVSKDLNSKMRNGTYMFNCTCTRCGTEQRRAHGNLINSHHPRCVKCDTTHSRVAALRKQKEINPGPGIVILFHKNSTVLGVSHATVPAALDSLTAEAFNWLVDELPEMAITVNGEKSEMLKGVNYHELRNAYSLRKTCEVDAAYDLPKLVKVPMQAPTEFKAPEALEEFRPPPAQPLRDEYLTIQGAHFKFFDWANPVDDEPPKYLLDLVEEFERTKGDITAYTFSSSPAPGNQVFIYWTKPTRDIEPLVFEPVQADPSLILTEEDEKALTVSTFNWNENERT